MNYQDYMRGWNQAIESAAVKSESWGDECGGGAGREIITEGPRKDQMYGQAYYNLAESIRKLMLLERRKSERRKP